MKIGIVLSGHLRSYRSTNASFEQFRNLLNQLGDVDVFCHTWDIEESVTNSWWKEHKQENPPPPTVIVKDINEKYRPVSFIVEPSRQFDDSGFNISASIPVAGILSMLYSQGRSYELLCEREKKTGKIYDIIIRTRYDLLYEISPVFRNLVTKCVQHSCIFLPSSNVYELLGSFSDVFAIGDGESMRKYFTYCKEFKNSNENYFKQNYNLLVPELGMTVYLEQAGLKYEYLNGLRLHILRQNGEKFQINSDKNFNDNSPLCFYGETIDNNKKVISGNGWATKNHSSFLVKKYMAWVNEEAQPTELEQYADFYSGHWINAGLIKKLAAKGKNCDRFTPNVMKNFFEESFCSATYGWIKKFRLAVLLLIYSGYGFFFFRVWKNSISPQKN